MRGFHDQQNGQERYHELVETSQRRKKKFLQIRNAASQSGLTVVYGLMDFCSQLYMYGNARESTQWKFFNEIGNEIDTIYSIWNQIFRPNNQDDEGEEDDEDDDNQKKHKKHCKRVKDEVKE